MGLMGLRRKEMGKRLLGLLLLTPWLLLYLRETGSF
jgi:hypothetical protein